MLTSTNDSFKPSPVTLAFCFSSVSRSHQTLALCVVLVSISAGRPAHLHREEPQTLLFPTVDWEISDILWDLFFSHVEAWFTSFTSQSSSNLYSISDLDFLAGHCECLNKDKNNATIVCFQFAMYISVTWMKIWQYFKTNFPWIPPLNCRYRLFITEHSSS